MFEYLNQIIDKRITEGLNVTITHGTVKSLRETDCDVDREFKPELLGVRFHSIIGTVNNHLTIIPKEGSQVLCALIEDNPAEAVIISYSEIESFLVKIDQAEFVVKQGKFTIKNNQADLKSILKECFETLDSSIITTPSGPGRFSPADKLKFQDFKNRTLNLFL